VGASGGLGDVFLWQHRRSFTGAHSLECTHELGIQIAWLMTVRRRALAPESEVQQSNQHWSTLWLRTAESQTGTEDIGSLQNTSLAQ
jgi:hypothetical protein